jgi:hypothetical protein
VRVLRQLGVAVYNIRKPVDLLVWHRGVYHIVEVKGSHKEYTQEQKEFLDRWPGKVHTVRTAAEAVEALMPDVCR